MLTILPFDAKASSRFDKVHAVKVSNGHCNKRYVLAEILARKDADFIRFKDACPHQILNTALLLHNAGYHVTGIYVYYIPFNGYNLYDEADPWFMPNNTPGCTNQVASLRSHCNCR